MQTQFEAWLSLQCATPGGLVGAGEGERRCEVVCLHNALDQFEGQKIFAIWGRKTVAEAHEILSRPDVVVTNHKDKEMQLPKIFEIDALMQQKGKHLLAPGGSVLWIAACRRCGTRRPPEVSSTSVSRSRPPVEMSSTSGSRSRPPEV